MYPFCMHIFEIQDYQTALKSYISRKDKDLNKLMEYAKSFRIDKKIREYMEVIRLLKSEQSKEQNEAI